MRSKIRLRFQQTKIDNKLMLFREDGKSLDRVHLSNIHLKFTANNLSSSEGIYIENLDGGLKKISGYKSTQNISGDDIFYR